MSRQPDQRSARETRNTKETQISLGVCVGVRTTDVQTGIGFFDHMLTAMSFHGRLGLTVEATGDLHVDYHHMVEDVGIVLGRALRKAIGPDPSIVRFGHAAVPMDESLSLVAVDVSGRGGAFVDERVAQGWIRDFDASLVTDFLKAFAGEAGITLHVRLLCGRNVHHQLESVFKGLGLALRDALTETGEDDAPSTKGTLEK